MSATSASLKQKATDISDDHESPPCPKGGAWPSNLGAALLDEAQKQGAIALPLVIMNLTWFAKTAISTAFLGRLGELQLAGGTLGFTFANVTGFSVLTGLCGAMEPICGQAYGAKNFKLLQRALLMVTLLLLLASLPISFLWLQIDKILVHFGQQGSISAVSKAYIIHLLPDLALTSFLCPLKAYLSAQGVTVPIMISSAMALAFHVAVSLLLCKAKGLEGVAMAVWVTDLFVTVLLGVYVWVTERGEWKKGWRWHQSVGEWVKLLRLSGPCCLTTCLEWWCLEILVLLAGRLADPNRSVSILAIVLNFDYLLYSVMLSLGTSASTRVSNELGADRARVARRAAFMSLALSISMGLIGGATMASARGVWASLYSHHEETVNGVKRAMLLMAVVEVVNFPLAVCGGIVRGTARPLLALYANLGGFYLLALPLGAALAFRKRLGLEGLLLGFLVGMTTCAGLLIAMVFWIDWIQEAEKAEKLVSISRSQGTVGDEQLGGDIEVNRGSGLELVATDGKKTERMFPTVQN